MIKKLIPVIVLVIVAALVTVSIISRNKKKYKTVDTVKVIQEDFSREVSANGEILSADDSTAISKINGNIEKIHVEVGDHVTKGQLLVTIEKKDLEAQRRKAEAALESSKMAVRKELLTLRTSYTQAISSHDQAKRDYDRANELHKIGSASDEEFRIKEDALNVASQNLEAAREQLNFREGRSLDDPRETPGRSDATIVKTSAEVLQAESNLETVLNTIGYYEIRSLSDGILTRLNVEEGGVVSVGAVVATVHDNTRMEVVTNIDEVDLSYLSTGQEVKIESDSFIDEEIYGEVSEIAPIIRQVGDSRVCEIRVSITQDPKHLARIGASCSVFIQVEKRDQVPAIPVQSYFLKEGKKYVALLLQEENEENDIYSVKLREIETGILGVETVEIKEGIEVDELIIAKSPASFGEDDKVKIKSDKKEDKEEST